MSGFALYLHIPFCLHKCPYCDFNTYAVSGIPEKEYVGALLAELDARASLPEWNGRLVNTIYFGGGTPSLLSPRAIRKIVDAICSTFPVDDRAEISLEANPGSINEETMSGLRDARINRISFGSQSFQSETLRTLGRIHTPEQIELAVEHARAAGLRNINLDLIYGVPGQTMQQLQADVRAIAALNPEHVSAYGLTIEKGTPFYTSYKKGLLKLPREKVIVDMMEEICSSLPKIGLARYEISNFSKPGREARHNMAYWDGSDYLGLGAGAHSLCVVRNDENSPPQPVRWSNFALPNRYMNEASAKGIASSWSDTLKIKDWMFEFFFLGLRRIAGVSLSQFEQRFGCSVRSLYATRLEVMLEQGLLKQEGDRLFLTANGLMVADSVFEEFIEPANSGEISALPNVEQAPQARAIAANDE